MTLPGPEGKYWSLIDSLISLSKPWASAKYPPKIPCNSGNSFTNSDNKSTFDRVHANSTFSLLIKNSSDKSPPIFFNL